ncbi:hypothetical protein DEM26_00380 [Thioclava sp. NG1]|uniref:FadR/GntR family transcriptional regulator n=1 Tax=Thioclava sp. NG1 TaxID=2182426 RepID=UPI000D6203B1|nr:FCD domain-containing protein [Thioclava sp. NG1]PWE51461.1 hypothetical protein DEM26_00380 [Thioclava sp. NG1]
MQRRPVSFLAALSAHCDALEVAASRGEFALAVLDLHRQILRLSGNRFLQSLCDPLQTALYSLLASETEDQKRGPSKMAKVVALHSAIVRAVENREPEAAKKAMKAVLERSSDECLRSRGMG